MEKEKIEKLAEKEYPYIEVRGLNEQVINATNEECRKAFIKDYQKAQEWISVKDRLPGNYETVLCYGKPVDGGFGITHCEHSDGIFRFCDSERENKSTITHWMERPQPPKH